MTVIPAELSVGGEEVAQAGRLSLPGSLKGLIGSVHIVGADGQAKISLLSAVQRTPSALSGVLTIDGLTVAVDTPQPLVWSGTCAQPSGQVRLTGKSVVLVTFAPGPNCAPPT